MPGVITSTRALPVVNVVSTVGSSILALGFLLILIVLTWALVRGPMAGNNRWHSRVSNG